LAQAILAQVFLAQASLARAMVIGDHVADLPDAA